MGENSANTYSLVRECRRPL